MIIVIDRSMGWASVGGTRGRTPGGGRTVARASSATDGDGPSAGALASSGPASEAASSLGATLTIWASTPSMTAAVRTKTAGRPREGAIPRPLKATWRRAEAAGPTMMPSCDAADTRLSPKAACLRGSRSVTPDCATGTLAAKTPASARPATTPVTVPERPMSNEEAAAPTRQSCSTRERPILDDSPTIMGANVIWDTEKHETARPTIRGCAPSPVR